MQAIQQNAELFQRNLSHDPTYFWTDNKWTRHLSNQSHSHHCFVIPMDTPMDPQLSPDPTAVPIDQLGL